MRERNVVVCNIIEEVKLLFGEHERCSNRVNWSITPALVEEAAVLVEALKVVDVSLASQPVKIANLKVGPEVAVVVSSTTIVRQEMHRVALGDVFWVLLHECLDAVPERWNGLDVFVEGEHEGVLLSVVGHVLEGIVVDVAEELDGWLNTPVPFIIEHEWVTEEEARLVSAHVSVADRVAIDDLLFSHVLANLGRLVGIDPLWERPVFLGDLAVLGLARREGGSDLLEGVVELGVIEEDPIVVELAVKTVLNLSNGACNLPHIRVSSKRLVGSTYY